MKNVGFKTIPSLILCLSLGAVSAFAGNYTNLFDTNPTADPNFMMFGNGVWRSTGSYNGSGYVSLTDAINSQQTQIIGSDFGSGATVVGFDLHKKRWLRPPEWAADRPRRHCRSWHMG